VKYRETQQETLRVGFPNKAEYEMWQRET